MEKRPSRECLSFRTVHAIHGSPPDAPSIQCCVCIPGVLVRKAGRSTGALPVQRAAEDGSPGGEENGEACKEAERQVKDRQDEVREIL